MTLPYSDLLNDFAVSNLEHIFLNFLHQLQRFEISHINHHIIITYYVTFVQNSV